MDRARWQRISAELDALLDLDSAARGQRLDALRAEDPTFADEIERLLTHEETRDHRIDTPLVTAPPGPREGERIGPYRLDALLGEGGMGQVWQAERADGLYARRVALKLLRPGLADPTLRLRFSRERDILARLAHPHIARLLDAGIGENGQPYLALEFVEGRGILAYAREHALDTRERIALFRQVCGAVSHAHANLIVHRDLKPSNILVSADGEVRLLDFGIAKLLDDPQEPIEHTRTGLRPFTLHYAAPEQVRGEVVTTKTDVYSLGVVLYELLTGQKPYRLKRESSAQWEDAILAAEPQRPSLAVARDEGDTPAQRRRISRELSGDLDNIVTKALAKLPEQRYPSAEALSSDLERYLGGLPVLARGQSFFYRTRKFVRRQLWPIATGLGIAALLLVLLGVALWQRKEAIREAARAQALQALTVGLFENVDAARKGKPVDVATFLDAAEARGERELGLQPQAHAELLGAVASYRVALGQYPRAADLLERQRKLVAALPDAPASLQLDAVSLRGRVQRLLGDPDACRRTLEPLLGLASTQQAQLPAHVAEFDSQLARCRRGVGDRDGAQRLFEQSLALRKSALGDDIAVVENLTDLAALSVDAGNYPDALARFQGALAQLHKIAGDRHPLAIDILRSIGVTQRAMGDITTAARSIDQALALSESLQGPDHPVTLALRAAAAQSAEDLSQWDKAQSLWQQLNTSAQTSNDSSDLARNWLGLGRDAYELGDLERARSALQRAIRLSASPRRGDLQFSALLLEARASSERGDAANAHRLTEAAQKLLDDGTVHGNDAQQSLATTAAHVELDADAAEEAVASLQPLVAHASPKPSEAQALLLSAQARASRDGAELDRLRDQLDVAGKVADVPATRLLSLRFRLYAADAQCRNNPLLGRQRYDALMPLLGSAQPEGGALSREAVALHDDCEHRAPSPTPARRGQSSRANGSGH
ncbi:serine/threonine-protein kinase [Solilutibacter silvestris]|uniref:Protein kinase domain n=1 Tax=Solilutibacter silvestris TaxID=1645665 RepID=A0A2K1Q0Q9_9GAMM|nr:serine/threonine-protein kinase [Lysobacter silvestris]PNS08629.1 Protein kinase domain [Lysobacter silvestris]